MSGSKEKSILFIKVFSVIYLFVAVIGLFTRDVLGLVILEPADTIIYFAFAIVSMVIGGIEEHIED